jgi:hypothetical protein
LPSEGPRGCKSGTHAVAARQRSRRTRCGCLSSSLRAGRIASHVTAPSISSDRRSSASCLLRPGGLCETSDRRACLRTLSISVHTVAARSDSPAAQLRGDLNRCQSSWCARTKMLPPALACGSTDGAAGRIDAQALARATAATRASLIRRAMTVPTAQEPDRPAPQEPQAPKWRPASASLWQGPALWGQARLARYCLHGRASSNR